MDKSDDGDLLISPSVEGPCYRVVSSFYSCRQDRVQRSFGTGLAFNDSSLKSVCSSCHTCPHHDIDDERNYMYCRGTFTTGKEYSLFTPASNEFSLFTPARNYLDRCGTTTKAYAKDLAGKSVLVVVFWVPFDKPQQLIAPRVFFYDQADLLWRNLIRNFCNDEFVLVLDILTKPGHELDEANFYQLLSAFPSSCLAVPYHDEQSRRSIATLVESLTYSPQDPGALAICQHGFAQLLDVNFLRSYGRDCYPFTDNNYVFLDRELMDLRMSGRGLSLESLLSLSSTSTTVALSATFPLPLTFTAVPLEFLKSKTVGLYLCCAGELMEQLSQVYRNCSLTPEDFVIVMIYQPGADGDLDAFQERMNRKLFELGIHEWFILAFDEKVSRKLGELCYGHLQDILFMVGPNNSYVELDGFAMIRHYSPWFGYKELFPFTKARVKEIIMSQLNLRFFLGSAKNLADAQGNVISVSDVEKKRNILLHLCYGSSQNDILEDLFTWYEDLKQTTLDFELILVCLDEDHDSCFGADTPKMPWPVAHHSQADTESVTKFCAVAGFSPIRLIAIRDGKAVTLHADFKIKRFWKIFKTAVFPDRDTLREEVAKHFFYRHVSHDLLGYNDLLFGERK